MSHFIQRAGIPTTSISLIREHSELVRPPRALWVSFPLGRPLGVPDDPGFQRDVVRAALQLLETATEPTIADYPIDAPAGDGPGAWACPISLPQPGETDLLTALRAEVERMAPWQRETQRARGRTAVGMSGATVEQIDRMVEFLVAIAEGASPTEFPPGAEEVDWHHRMPILIRHVAEDLRAFYQEAIAAQPNAGAPTHAALNTWIFRETAFGRTLTEIGHRLAEAGDNRLLVLRGYLIPEGFWKGEHTWGPPPDGMSRTQFALEANAFLSGEED